MGSRPLRLNDSWLPSPAELADADSEDLRDVLAGSLKSNSLIHCKVSAKPNMSNTKESEAEDISKGIEDRTRNAKERTEVSQLFI